MKPFLSVAVILVVLGGCGTQTAANNENFANGMNAYLEQRGHLCLAKYAWPIDLTRSDFDSATRDAVQSSSALPRRARHPTRVSPFNAGCRGR